MDIAVNLAEKYKGTTYPNPAVGALLVKDNKIIAKSVTGISGSPHAEYALLEGLKKEDISGCDLYVTLEPCSHQGKNPACTDIIIASGIRRVFFANYDPNPLVNGKGIAKLQASGIEVKLLADNNPHKEFCYFHKYNKPYVKLKIALSADNYSAYNTQDQQWITSEFSRLNGHILRYKADAILTGINTVRKDNPKLNVRLANLKKNNAIIMLLDSKLDIALESNLVKLSEQQKLVIFTGQKIASEKAKKLLERNIEIVRTDLQSDGKISLKFVMDYCMLHHIANLHVEAGKKLTDEFMQNNLAQELIIYQSDFNLGVNGCNKLTIPKSAQLISSRKILTDTKKIYKLN